MKIITEPSVYVIGRQTVDDGELNRFLSDHGIAWESDSEVAGEILAETAGRTCYMSFSAPRPGGNAAYLHHIKEAGHGSVLEHAVWTLLITGVSRSLSHELIRHRAGVSPSQLSQRYVDESVAEYVEPKVIADDPELHAIWLHTVETAHQGYKMLADKLDEKFEPELARRYRIDPDLNANDPLLRESDLALIASHRTNRRKAARQAARSVLPNATETKLVITANARAIRNMLEQRCSRHAEPEIRQLFYKVWGLMMMEAPNLFSDYVRVPLPDGSFELSTPYRKV